MRDCGLVGFQFSDNDDDGGYERECGSSILIFTPCARLGAVFSVPPLRLLRLLSAYLPTPTFPVSLPDKKLKTLTTAASVVERYLAY